MRRNTSLPRFAGIIQISSRVGRAASHLSPGNTEHPCRMPAIYHRSPARARTNLAAGEHQAVKGIVGIRQSAMSRALRYDLLSAACCLLSRPAERLGGLLAETSAISAGKFSEIAKSAFESDRSHRFPGERGLQHAVSALQSAVAQKPLRGCPKMATKASLEMADAHPERCSQCRRS